MFPEVFSIDAQILLKTWENLADIFPCCCSGYLHVAVTHRCITTLICLYVLLRAPVYCTDREAVYGCVSV